MLQEVVMLEEEMNRILVGVIDHDQGVEEEGMTRISMVVVMIQGVVVKESQISMVEVKSQTLVVEMKESLISTVVEKIQEKKEEEKSQGEGVKKKVE